LARVTNFEQTGHGQWTAAYTVKNDSEITPYAGIVYDLSENYSAYASYTSIFLPQNLKDYGGKIRSDRRQGQGSRHQGRVPGWPRQRLAGRVRHQAGQPGPVPGHR
jgi:hypothetical protein